MICEFSHGLEYLSVSGKKATTTNTALALLALLLVKSYYGFDYNFNTFFLIVLLDLAVAFTAEGWGLSSIRKSLFTPCFISEDQCVALETLSMGPVVLVG